MAKGLPKAIIAKYGISKKAWSVFRGRKANKAPKRHMSVVRHMARRAKRRFSRARFRGRRRRDTRIPIIPTIAFVSTFATPCPSGRSVVQDVMNGDWEGALYDAREKFAGIDNTGKFRPEWLIQTYGPVVVGALVSKFAGKLVNPTIRKIPLVGKYLKL